MSDVYIASKPPGRLMSETTSDDFDECVSMVMDIEGKSWEWLRDHGWTVDKYEVGDDT